MNATYDVWTDPDLAEFVRAEPELAAIADALAGARAASATPRRRRLRPAQLAAVAAVLAAAVAVALAAPWQRSSGGLADLALAALGSGPVLHVVAETPTGAQLVDLGSGRSEPVVQRDEIWYDADLGLKRGTMRVGQEIIGDVLETPQGGYTPGGIVYDCAWIAAHPVEATQARVSCNASGDNGTTPHTIPRPKPSLDPGLAGFVDGYRQALASGLAADAGSGSLDGEPVDWLAFRTPNGTEKVALDASTHEPVLLQQPRGGPRTRIEMIETIPYDAADLARPAAAEIPPQPARGDATDAQSLPPDGAAIAAAVPGAVWAGPSVAALPLVRAERESITATYAGASQPPQTGTGLELDYGTLTAAGRLDRSQPFVGIEEAPSAALAFADGWGFVRGPAPPAGSLAVVGAGMFDLGFTVAGGEYVSISASGSDLLRQAARALAPAG